MYPCRCSGSIPESRVLPPITLPGLFPLGLVGFHFALRRSSRKTVMESQSSRMPSPEAAGAVGDNENKRQALDELFSLTYEELRRLASCVRRGDPSCTMNPTALVNEAWIKLANSPRFAHTSPLHFKRIAARAMRQVLVEAARRRHANKRGGGTESRSSSPTRWSRWPHGETTC